MKRIKTPTSLKLLIFNFHMYLLNWIWQNDLTILQPSNFKETCPTQFIGGRSFWFHLWLFAHPFYRKSHPLNLWEERGNNQKSYSGETNNISPLTNSLARAYNEAQTSLDVSDLDIFPQLVVGEEKEHRWLCMHVTTHVCCASVSPFSIITFL